MKLGDKKHTIIFGGDEVPAEDNITFEQLGARDGAVFSIQYLRALFHIDFDGKWIGHDADEGYVYDVRLTVCGGEHGENLWHGTDEPFRNNSDMQIPKETLEEMQAQPADKRVGGHRIATNGAAGILADRGGACGDEIMVGGALQWYVDAAPESQPWNELETIQRQRGIEHVCGSYSPSARRLVVVGTHKANTNHEVFGLEVTRRDLIRSPSDT